VISVRLGPRENLPFDPFDGRPLRLRVSARPLSIRDWIVLDDRTENDLAEKDRLLGDPATHRACVALLPDTDVAKRGAEELCRSIEAHLVEHEPDHLRDRSAHIPVSLEPIDRAGRLVPEDWCLLAPLEHDGAPVLIGASLCFPNRWRLHDKLGLPMSAIHGPVPGYEEQIGTATDRALARLTPSTPISRINWSIHDDARLHQPTGHFDPTAGSWALDVGRDVVLRIERQTLVRLPETGVIVFGIRTIIRTLNEVLTSDPEVALRMATALRTMNDNMRAYKSLVLLAPVVIDWLESRRRADR
jgi:dimethylamine monooxygenase subunit A